MDDTPISSTTPSTDCGSKMLGHLREAVLDQAEPVGRQAFGEALDGRVAIEADHVAPVARMARV
jgi:hypothetical protein